ncbi:hypothetical protein GMMP1_1010008 [Candidatus Magnetomoraceae bacterium gMMP-1]
MLNPAQYDAVISQEGPVLVIAGAESCNPILNLANFIIDQANEKFTKTLYTRKKRAVFHEMYITMCYI